MNCDGTVNCQQIIESIRNEYRGVNDMPREGLYKLARSVAEDLQEKDSHFIFELIQNAEDNRYDSDVVPSISFKFVANTEGQNGVRRLIVVNNESGFIEENVRTICTAGKTTKQKNAGYIGEKGIGFKSVFIVTTCPHIHSNGFSFCLPERDDETGLGYFVPKWLRMPSGVDQTKTTIILPLDKSPSTPDDVARFLNDISPETILFLRKVQKVSIEADDLCTNRSFVRNGNATGPVYLMETANNTGDGPTLYWKECETFDVPDEIKEEKRKGISKREISIAIHLCNDLSEEVLPYNGKLFAYLPVYDNTGLPFLINADFLLNSGRERIKEGKPWNKWLVGHISHVYQKAFLSGLESSELSLQNKIGLYASIPLRSNIDYLEDVVRDIRCRLGVCDCVITSSESFDRPEHCRMFPKKAWAELLTDGDDTPSALQSGVVLVHPSLSGYKKQLHYIGVADLSPTEIGQCLSDCEWVGRRPIEWFVRLYQELDAKFGDMRALPILPVVMFDGGQQTCRCADGLHIYRRLTDEDRKEIDAFPRWAREHMPIASCAPGLLDRIDALPDEALKKINELFKNMGIKESFSIDEYVSHVVKKLGANAAELSKDQVFTLTDYLLKREWKEVKWSDLPVVLADGQIMRVENAKSCRPAGLVVPEGYDPEAGWQYIWKQPDDRKHFVVLDSAYVCFGKRAFEYIKPDDYPEMQRVKISNVDECRTPSEKTALGNTRDMRQKYKDKAYIESCVFPNIGTHPSEATGKALVGWVNYRGVDLTDLYKYKLALIRYCIDYRTNPKDGRCRTNESAQMSPVAEWLKTNAWLPTTKGLRVPSHAYLKRRNIEEIFGDRVAFFEGTLPQGTITYLGIKEEITAETLIDELKKQAGRPDADVELLRRIYGQLKDRNPSVKDHFARSSLIAVHDGNAGVTWHTVNQCVWEDASDSLGNAFCYLAKWGPDLRPFFVGELGVRDRVDADHYLQKLVDLSRQQSQEIEPAKRLYRHLKAATLTELQKARFRSESLIATRTKGGAVRWHEAETCVWDCDDELFGDALGCLKKSFGDEDRQFFVETLGVEERPKLNHYLDCWLRCQKLPDAEQTAKREQVEKLYCEIGKHSREWNSEPFSTFFKSAHVYTRRSVFRPGREVFWPDDGQLVEVFSTGVEYAWLPDNVAYVSWRDFLGKAEVKPLSECAKSQLISELHQAPVAETNCYLTPAAVQMIVTYIRQMYPEAYKCKWDQGVFDRLARTREVQVDQPIVVLYRLGNREEKRDSSAYWDEQNCRLYLRETDGKSLKSEIATHLALLLSNKSHEDCFETYLREESLQRLVKKRWNLPDEIRDLYGKNSADPGSEHGHDPLVADGAASSQPQEPQVAGSAKTQQPATVTGGGGLSDTPRQTPVTPSTKPPAIPAPSRRTESPRHANEATAPGVRFNPFVDNPGREALEPRDDEEAGGSIRNPEHFIPVVTEDTRERLKSESHPDERRRHFESDRLEPADEQVRAGLLDYYHGECQICRKTFPKRDGSPYFVAAHFESREDGRFADCIANAICLCAEHFAKWCYAAWVFDKENTSRILEIDPITGVTAIRVRLAGQVETITYVPAHFAKFQALYREAGPRQEPGSADQEPQADSGACNAPSGL